MDDYCWRVYYQSRFIKLPQETSQQEPPDYKLLYKKQSRLIISATEFDIAWLDNQYWRFADFHRSPFGRVAELNMVCWLDVCGRIAAVPRGRYHTFWNLQLKPDSSIKRVIFETKILSGQTSSDEEPNLGSTASFTLAQLPFHQFTSTVDMCVHARGQSIDIKEPHATVQFHAYDHSDRWKSGLTLDYVVLVKSSLNKKQRSHYIECLEKEIRRERGILHDCSRAPFFELTDRAEENDSYDDENPVCNLQ